MSAAGRPLACYGAFPSWWAGCWSSSGPPDGTSGWVMRTKRDARGPRARPREVRGTTRERDAGSSFDIERWRSHTRRGARAASARRESPETRRVFFESRTCPCSERARGTALHHGDDGAVWTWTESRRETLYIILLEQHDNSIPINYFSWLELRRLPQILLVLVRRTIN